VVVVLHRRIIYYCADPLERRTGDDGEELDGFEFDNRSDYDDFDYYDEPLDDEFNPELDFVRRGDSTDDEPGFSRNGGVPSPPSNSASPQTAIDFLTQLIGQLPSFVVSQDDGNPEFEVLGTGNRP